MKKILRVLGIVLLIPFLIFILILILVYLPPVQNLIRKEVVQLASKATDMDIRIEKIGLYFPLRLKVEGVEVFDKNDTILSLTKLEAQVKLLPLLKQQVDIDGFTITDARVNTADIITGMNVSGNIGEATLQSRGIDLKKEEVLINNVSIKNSNINLILKDTTEAKEDTTASSLNWNIVARKISLEKVALALQMPDDTLDLSSFIEKLTLNDATVDLKDQHYQLALLKVEDSRVDYASGEQLLSGDGFNPSYIKIRKFNTTFEDLNYQGKSIAAVIKELSFVERSGLEVSSIEGELRSDSTTINIPSLSIKTPHSNFSFSAETDWSLLETQEEGKLSLLLNADIGKQDIFLLTGKITDSFQKRYPFRPLTLKMNVDGDMQRINLNELKAELPGAFNISANGVGISLMDSVRRDISIDLKGQTGRLDFILALLEPAQQKQFAIPVNMRIAGDMRMHGAEAKANLALNEGAGKLLLNAMYNSDIQSYQAKLNIDTLQLNHFMPNDSLYALTATADLKGRGFDVFSSRTSINANVLVDNFRYANYELSGIKLAAKLDSSKVDLTLDSHNQLIDLQTRLNGLLQKNKVDLRLNMNVANLDLYKLEVTEKPLDVAFALNMQLGSDLKQRYALGGSLQKMKIKTEEENYAPKDIWLVANTNIDTTVVSINAGDLLFWARGTGGLEQLSNRATMLSNELTKQIDEKRLEPDKLKEVLPNIDIHLNAGSENPLSHFLNVSGMGFKAISFDLNTSPEKGLNGNSHIFAFHTDSLQLDTIRLKIDQDTTAIKLAASVANNPDNKRITFRSTIDGEIGENQAKVRLKFFNKKEQLGVDLGLLASLKEDGVLVNFFPDQPTFVYRPYNLNDDNYIFLRNDNRVRANVSMLSNDGTGFRLYSIPADTTVLQDIAVELRKWNLKEIGSVIPYMPDIEGIFSAEAHYTQTIDALQIAADLRVDSFAYEKNRMETIQLEAVYLPGENKEHHIDGLLSYAGAEALKVNGVYYSQEQGKLDANATFEHFPLNIANMFIPDGMAQLTGDMDGGLNVTGKMDKPLVNGSLVLDSVSVSLPQYGFNFNMDNKPLEIKGSQLNFNKYNIYTRGNNPFVINGKVDFANLSDMRADLTLNASDYELLNAERNNESLLYGKVFVDLNSTVRGPLDALVVRGGVQVQGRTDVTYVLKESPLVAQDRLGEMVTFVDFTDTTTVVKDTTPKVELGGMDVLMTVSIDQAAQVRVDLTPDRASYVELEGGGDLSLQYTELNGMQLVGRYTLTSGKLKYTLVQFLAREFTITNGSYVDWSGNITDPFLDITAVNHVRATVSNQNDVARKVNFEATLSIKNKLEDLQLVFGMDAPEDMTIKNELAAMSEEELSKQAVAMMITGTYMGPSGGGNMGNSALNTLLQGAIQGVAGGALKSIDITLGVEQSGTSDNLSTDYSFTFAKRFWNDRINVIIGGKVSTGNEANAEKQSFIDNVAIEYRLDNTGTRYLRLFHDINYDSILDGEIVETGAGVVLRRKMSKLKDLFTFRRKKKALETVDNESLNIAN